MERQNPIVSASIIYRLKILSFSVVQVIIKGINKIKYFIKLIKKKNMNLENDLLFLNDKIKMLNFSLSKI
jgi:hypothetical protein